MAQQQRCFQVGREVGLKTFFIKAFECVLLESGGVIDQAGDGGAQFFGGSRDKRSGPGGITKIGPYRDRLAAFFNYGFCSIIKC